MGSKRKGNGIVSQLESESSAKQSSLRSFKMKRNSAMASNLKSSISKHLRHLLGSLYTDDVLAEYITVLVCNGKNQSQATQDLEAFLGKQTANFVSWVWDLLLKYAHESNKDICSVSAEKDIAGGTTCVSQGEEDPEINRLKDFQSHAHGSVNTDDDLMVEDDEIYRLPTTSKPVSYRVNDDEFAEDFQPFQSFSTPSSETNSKKVLAKSRKTEFHRRIGPADDDFYVTFENRSLGKGSSSLIPVGMKEKSRCMDMVKKIVLSSSNSLPDQLVSVPRRDPTFRSPQPSTPGKSLFPRSSDSESHQREKPRVSVWDRLGKPCDDITPRGIAVEVDDGFGTLSQNQEVLNQYKAVLVVSNREHGGRMTGGIASPCNNHSELRKVERGMGTMHEPYAANNIRQKRHFDEICTDPGALVCRTSNELLCQDFPQNSKKPNLTKEYSKTNPNLILEVLDAKQKLHKIEMEMSSLWSKQVGMKKDGNSNLLSHSDGNIHAKGDVSSRTVFVTNVHFTATKEALSLYFEKCGVVDNVVILTDKAGAQRIGSAYVTFANKDSVDKAAALSGATFFSRTLKVSRSADVTISASISHAGKQSQALTSYISMKAITNKPYYSSSPLQWRQDSSTSKVQPTPANFEEKQSAPTKK